MIIRSSELGPRVGNGTICLTLKLDLKWETLSLLKSPRRIIPTPGYVDSTVK